MLAVGADGFLAHRSGNFNIKDHLTEIREPTARRLFAIASALRANIPVKKMAALSGIDPWFLEKMKNVVDIERTLRRRPLTRDSLYAAKKAGFSDVQLAVIKHTDPEKIRALRMKLKVLPVVKQIDTLAGEF